MPLVINPGSFSFKFSQFKLNAIEIFENVKGYVLKVMYSKILIYVKRFFTEITF